MATLIYLHGFLSSPLSEKATQVKHWLANNRPDIDYICPHLRPYPKETQTRLGDLLDSAANDPIYLVGSSLGGFIATWLVEHYDLPAVLVNPLVDTKLLTNDRVGVELKNYHTDDTYVMTEQHAQEFHAMNIPGINRHKNYWVMLQTGDETLDYRLAIEKYHGSRQLVEQGGDHSFNGFQNWLPKIIDFFETNSRQ